jgi:hypothetical protein
MLHILAEVDSRSEVGAPVREIVELAEQAGRPRSVARASVSRALWRRGAVELHDTRSVGAGRTMSGLQQRARETALAAKTNPETFYEGALRFRKNVLKLDDPWGSASACVAAKERQAEETPRLRAVQVTITESGRQLLESRLTLPRVWELTAP